MRKNKWIAIILGIGMMAGALSGCSMISLNKLQPINSKKALASQQEILEAESLDVMYLEGLNEFAYQLFANLDKEENMFLSPYSISMALSMLYNSADTTTRTELADLLGYDDMPNYANEFSEDSNEFMNANSRHLMDILQNEDSKVQISIANSIWLAQNEIFQDTIETALLAPVRSYYNGDIYQVDFTQEKTLNEVNNWVSDKTEGMIDPFIEAFTDPEQLRLFLVNAIYFNGKWSKPFSPDDTVRREFHGTNTSTQVDMMVMTEEKYRYYAQDGIQAIEIPYGNELLVMDVLMPLDKENTKISELYEKLTIEEIKHFMQELDSVYNAEIATLMLPKFTMEYGVVELKDTLQELGMKDAFDKGKADFHLINDDIYVSSVVHKAKIEVEEWGTKAAAATGITMETTSAINADTLDFVVDVPFIFLIRDRETDTVLFIGQMNNMK
ncbi:MAG: Serine protease inhibitor [Herbinix sp.]|jgi:serpin B|nr:Serine protease inhibitor [Herbinix sp.]